MLLQFIQKQQKKQGFMFFSAVLSAIVFMMMAGVFFTLYGGQFSLIKNGKTAIQAQQYAEIDANTLQSLSYSNLDAKGAHSRKAITNITNASGWEDEITLSAEQILDEDAGTKQRIATVNIYKTGDTLPRYTLQIPLTSQGSGDSGVPIGTVITWPLWSTPDGWLECNGQYVNPSQYPNLAALMSYTPNYQGIFLRGYGSQYSYHYGTVLHSSGNLNDLQGDAIRNITGFVEGADHESEAGGAFYYAAKSSTTFNGSNNHANIFNFDASRVTPVANEIRPVNRTVRYLIKAK